MSVNSVRVRCCWLCIALLAIASVAITASPASAETKLRWKFEPAEVVNFELTMDMLQEMKVGDMPLTTKMGQKMDMEWVVKEVAEDGTAVMQQTIKRIRVELVPPAVDPKTIKYDSQSEEQEPETEKFAAIFDAMVGKSTTITVTPLGEVKNIELSSEMLDAIKKASPGGAGSMFSEDSVKQTISRSMFSFPPEVEKGTTWNVKLETPNPVLGKQIADTEYKYVGPAEKDGRSVEQIDIDLKMSFENKPDAQAQVVMKDQSGKGTIFFDNNQGLPFETSMDSRMTLEITIGGRSLEQIVTTKVAMKQTAPEPAE